jgi:hypothetical protein
MQKRESKERVDGAISSIAYTSMSNEEEYLRSQQDWLSGAAIAH